MNKILNFLFETSGQVEQKVESAKGPDREIDDDRIRRCPWPEDLHINVNSYIGVEDGLAHHYVSAAADGPNHGGDSFHHGSIGYWPDFEGFDDLNAFAQKLQGRILEITGYVAPMYAWSEEQNEHARWCMGEIDERPPGRSVQELPREFEVYEDE